MVSSLSVVWFRKQGNIAEAREQDNDMKFELGGVVTGIDVTVIIWSFCMIPAGRIGVNTIQHGQ